MLDRYELYEEVQGVLSMMGPEELPECRAYLAGLTAAGEGEIGATPIEVAEALMGMDRQEKLPEYMISFITELYESEAACGNDCAMNNLGALYYNGARGFEQSFEKAMFYYKLAAARGNRQARENLGYCYYYGRGGAPDYEAAFRCFSLGAFEGSAVSLYKIGDMYLKGLYVEKDEQEAFRIYMSCLRAISQEDESRASGPVHLRLGRMFLEGVGTEQSTANALICFNKAELCLYDMVARGEHMYRRSLREAIKGHTRAGALLEAMI